MICKHFQVQTYETGGSATRATGTRGLMTKLSVQVALKIGPPAALMIGLQAPATEPTTQPPHREESATVPVYKK